MELKLDFPAKSKKEFVSVGIRPDLYGILEGKKHPKNKISLSRHSPRPLWNIIFKLLQPKKHCLSRHSPRPLWNRNEELKTILYHRVSVGIRPDLYGISSKKAIEEVAESQ